MKLDLNNRKDKTMKYLILLLVVTTTAHAGQWTYTDPTPGGGYTTWTPGSQPIYTTPTPGGGYSTYNPNRGPSTYDMIRQEQHYDLHIRPHLQMHRH